MGELTALSISGFAALNVVFSCGWLCTVIGLRRRLKAGQPGREEF